MMTRAVPSQNPDLDGAPIALRVTLPLRKYMTRSRNWPKSTALEFRAQQKSCGRVLFMTACDFCFFAKKKTICWNVIVGNFSLLILVTVSRKSRRTPEGKRENPSAMIGRLVNGCVHSPSASVPHVCVRILSSSLVVFVASSAQETEKDISPVECERVRN